MKLLSKVSIILLLLFGIAMQTQANTIYIDQNNMTGNEDGSALAPYSTIQNALFAASANDTLRIAQGLYNDEIVIDVPGIVMLGGFPGGTNTNYANEIPGDFATRNTNAYRTILFGIMDQPVIRIIASNGSCYDGLYITGGLHGIMLDDTDWPPTMANITISNNFIYGNGNSTDNDLVGGAIALQGSNIRIVGNVIRNNFAGRGAAIGSIAEVGNYIIENNDIDSNSSSSDYGGALFLYTKGTIRNNRFTFNACGTSVGYGYGGAVSLWDSATVTGNTFIGNFAPTYGGALYLAEGHNYQVDHNLVVKNRANDGGAAIALAGRWDNVFSTANIDFCTIADNHSTGYSGGNALYLSGRAVARFSNSIAWNNSKADGLSDFHTSNEFDTIHVSYSNTADMISGVGIIHSNPLFADTNANNYYLKSRAGRYQQSGSWVLDTLNSPTIDAADPAALFANEPQPNGNRANMGCFGNTERASKTDTVPPLALGSADLPIGRMNTQYSHSFIASGGIPPYTFSLIDSELPAGFAMLPNGTLSGSSSQLGDFRLKVRVRDNEQIPQISEFSFTLTLIDPTIITFRTKDVPHTRLVADYLMQLRTLGGNTMPIRYRISSGQLPSGLSLDTLTGIISGRPASIGYFAFTVAASDASIPPINGSQAYYMICRDTTAPDARATSKWQNRGIGGGGALFGLSMNPESENEFFVSCDMGELFHTRDFGYSYAAVNAAQAVGNRKSKVQFTRGSLLRYTLNYANDNIVPIKSTDGGVTWAAFGSMPFQNEEIYGFWVDYFDSQRMILSYWANIYLSTNGGVSWASIHTAADNGVGAWVAGVFFDGNTILVGTNDGLLASTNGGASWTIDASQGIPAGQAILSMAGAKTDGSIRLMAVTALKSAFYNGMFEEEYWGLVRGVYSMDYGSTAWVNKSNGININSDFVTRVHCARSNKDIFYLTGASSSSAPIVIKTTDGGSTWQHTFLSSGNQNVRTGWSGQSGDSPWSYGEVVMSATVSEFDPNRLAFSDFGFVHASSDGGSTWQQCYTSQQSTHQAGTATPTKQAYRGIGLENTSCWQVFWIGNQRLFGAFSDIKAIISTDGGKKWSFDYSGPLQNTTYRIARHNTNGMLFAATSSIHDLYQSHRLQDAVIDAATASGHVLCSSDSGATWASMLTTKPVVWVATDPTNSDRLYAAVVNNTNSLGGIYRTNNATAGTSATWMRLTSPARTEGHPATITVLNDGSVVCTYSGRRLAAGGFTPSSGVFVFNPNNSQWTDVSDTSMYYWTKDLVVAPAGQQQNTWYVCVYSGWGGAPNGKGGIYRTSNRGTSWSKICSLDRVSSITFDPENSNTAYISTETEGLWVSNNISAQAPTFSRILDFPFMHPERVFFNPSDSKEMWVATMGNGMQMRKNVTHTIILDSAWNMFSVPLIPAESQFRQMFASLPAYKMVKTSSGQTYGPATDFQVQATDGYIIHSSRRDTLSVSGYELITESVKFDLQPGWNLVPYLPADSRNPSVAFAGLGSKVLAVKDGKGGIWVPAMGLNTLPQGTLDRDRSYWVYVSEFCQFRFSE